MNGLSLYSGAGIGELVFKQILPKYRTVGYVEWDKYCQSVIRARIADGILDDAPIFGDIRHFNERYASSYAGKVDWISGGFPCQPFSVAGRQLGEADERNMWPATRDAISIIRPEYAFLENVPGLLVHGYIRRIFGDLAEIGYDRFALPRWGIGDAFIEWDIVSAADVGAPHMRRRLWILAYSQCVGELHPSGTRLSGGGAPEPNRQDAGNFKEGIGPAQPRSVLHTDDTEAARLGKHSRVDELAR